MNVMTMVQRLTVALALAVSASSALAQASYRIQVDGLACPFCAYGIEKNLAALDGVAQVETDIASGSVTVTMTEGATLHETTAGQAVKAAGFRLRGFEPVGQSGPDESGRPAR